MIDRFLAFSKEKKLIKRGDRILVGISGGVDSVVLLSILLELKNKLNIEIAAAHINYGLRKESARDEKFVKNLVENQGVEFFSKKVKLTGGNIEEKARDIRYKFFNEILEKEKFTIVAVAHHKNDMVETFFLNSARGAGLKGLVSMRPKNRLDSRLHGNDTVLIRPLLFSKKEEILSYARKNGLRFFEDITNKDLSFKRNLVRHKVIPALELINPRLVETLAEEIENLSRVEEIVSKIIVKRYKKITNEAEDSVIFLVTELNELENFEKSEVLRMAILHVKKDLKDISRKNIDNLMRLLENENGTKKINMPSSLIAERIYGKLIIRKVEKRVSQKPKKIKLELEKEVIFGKWRLFLAKSEKNCAGKKESLVFLDINKTSALQVRCRKQGDRIAIGHGKTKSLQDVFVDTKTPAKDREAYPVVVDEKDQVVVIPGIRLNPEYKADGFNKAVILKAKFNSKEF